MHPAPEGRPLARRVTEPALFVVALLPVVLALRWGPLAGNWGEQLTPWPDAAEYAAGAQSLSETGRYFLQLGPWRVQPRYPPGYSLLLAAAVRLGVAGDQLWRVGALFEWGLVAMLALLVRALVLALSPRARLAAALAGLGAALTWMLAPMVAIQGSFVVSDQPTLLVAMSGLGAAAWGARRRRGGVSWAAAGVATGLTATMRLAEGTFLAVACVPLALATFRRRGGARAARAALLFFAGLTLPMLLAAGILHRSGFPATRWSTYRFWEPESFYSCAHMFSLEHALRGGIPLLDGKREKRRVPNAQMVGQVMAGWPGLFLFDYLGYFWPGLTLVLLPWLIPRIRGALPEADPCLVAATLWAACHLLLASVFVWPLARLLLPVLALTCGAYWTAIGVAWSGSPRSRALAIAGAALALGVGVWLTVERVRDDPVHEDVNAATRAAFADWLGRQPDVGRERVPFDSVRAQALGLLRRDDLYLIRSWGPLLESWHFSVLQANGYLCFQKGYGWNLDDVLRPREGRSPPLESR